MNRRLISRLALPMSLVVLSGCYTGEPVDHHEYLTLDGKVQEASWQNDSGTWTVRRVSPHAGPEDDPSSPDSPTHQTYDTPPVDANANGATMPAIQTPTEHTLAKSTKGPAIQAPRILGGWTVDVDATMRANAVFADEIRESIKEGLEYNPFDLSITNGMYVSKGKGTMEVMTDKYEVMSVEGDTVTIQLTPAVPTRKKRIGDGTITLSVRKSGLMIPGPGGVSIVMKRPAKDQSNSKQSSTDKKEP